MTIGKTLRQEIYFNKYIDNHQLPEFSFITQDNTIISNKPVESQVLKAPVLNIFGISNEFEWFNYCIEIKGFYLGNNSIKADSILGLTVSESGSKIDHNFYSKDQKTINIISDKNSCFETNSNWKDFKYVTHYIAEDLYLQNAAKFKLDKLIQFKEWYANYSANSIPITEYHSLPTNIGKSVAEKFEIKYYARPKDMIIFFFLIALITSAWLGFVLLIKTIIEFINER